MSLENSIGCFNKILGLIQQKMKTKNLGNLKEFCEKFQMFINSQADKRTMSNEEIANFSKAKNELKINFSILNFLFEKFASEDVLDSSIEREIGKLLLDGISKIFQNMMMVLNTLENAFNELQHTRRKQIELNFELTSNLYNQMNASNIQDLKDKIEALKKENETLTKKKADEKFYYEKKIENLARENRLLINKLKSKVPLELKQDVVLNTSQSEIKDPLGINTKNFPLKYIKEFINELYLKKIEYDSKCLVNHRPKKTLEAFMYEHLNNKFGLKNLVVEFAGNLICAVKKYRDVDGDIKLFEKILKNEQEEEAWIRLKHLKDVIDSKLEKFLLDRTFFKTKEETKKK